MATPPVPPRPFDSYDQPPSRKNPSAPPLPPLPPDFRPRSESSVGSLPHFEDPLVAPRPHKLQPDLPANMARTLHDQMSTPISQPSVDYGRGRTPQAGLAPPAFAATGRDHSRGPNPYASQGQEWSPWAGIASPPPPLNAPGSHPFPSASYPQSSGREDVASSIAALSLSPQPPPHHQHQLHHQHPSHHQHSHSQASSPYGSPPQVTQSLTQGGGPSQQPQYSTSATLPLNIHPTNSPPRQDPPAGAPSLTAPLPTIGGLTSAMSSIQQPGADPAAQVIWCRDVLSLVSRAESLQTIASSPTNVTSSDPPVGPVRIGDPALQRLVDVAVPLVLKVSTPSPMPNPIPAWLAEAIYLRATCEASGAYPQYIPQSSRSAFRDFEQAARSGHHVAWFKLGRDYENFNDVQHAKNCFERGVNLGDERCLYRMGMAHLMGQLGLQPSPEAAVPLLHRAATLASVDVPQPAYVYGLLLLAEFSHISIPPQYFTPFIPPGSSAQNEARKHLERAAYLNFSPAQYKLGHSYEFATPPFPFDPLLSVQYYSLASQQGEIEADMALSKWFLCGAEGAFAKDEGLAYTFAEKAAKKGLPSAEFAMGYYAEVGVGGSKDLEDARRWYTKAAEHGNEDAKERLSALSQPTPQSLSRAEHENLTESKLVRTRTQAKQRSDAAGSRPPPMPAMQGAQIVENVRKNSIMRPAVVNAVSTPAGTPGHPNYGAPFVEEPRAHGRPSSAAPVPQQPPASQRPFANAPRYSLADPGLHSAAGPRPPSQHQQSFGPPSQHQQSFGPPRQNRPAQPPQGRPPGPSQSPSFGSPMPTPPIAGGVPPPKKGAQTFAELGIATAKVEEKECIIM